PASGREAFSEVGWKFEHDKASLRRGSWCYIDSKEPGRKLEMLFDRATDPSEAKNVIADHPDVAAEMRAELRARLDRARSLAAAYERSAYSALPPSEQDRLFRLGYAGEK